MNAEQSQPMYEDFLRLLTSKYKPELVKGGEFGAYMQVHIQNDGPVTLLLESPQFPPAKERKVQGGAKKDVEKEGTSQSGSETGKTGSVDTATSLIEDLSTKD